MTVVVDTSPLIALDRIGCLEVLPRLFGHVIRPQSVVHELQAGKHIYGGSDALFHARWLTTMDDPPEMLLRKELGDGETAVIALALRMKAELTILDDLAARNVAAELGLNVTGTLGVLLAAHRKGILKNPRQALSALQDAGFRISDAIIKDIRVSIGDSASN